MAIRYCLLTRLTFVTLIRVQNFVAHALLSIILIFAELPSFLALQAFAIVVEICDLSVAPQACRLRLALLLLAVNAVDQGIAALLALRSRQSPIEEPAMFAFNALFRFIANAALFRLRLAKAILAHKIVKSESFLASCAY